MYNVRLVVAGAALALAWAASASAMDSARDFEPSSAEFVKGEAAVKAKKWDEAVESLQKAAAEEPQNADIHNYLGYAERHRGNLDAAFAHYRRALALDPKHRGAHEYMGEAYLVAGDLAKAEEHLAALDQLCFFSCAEYRELKEKIAEYKQNHR